MIKDKNSVLVGSEAKSYTRGIKKGGGGIETRLSKRMVKEKIDK